jgi:uncharacterized membrane protein required for colicin V production
MTIWLLALVVLASLAGLGYRQGAIRVGFSFVGILVGVWLAAPVGHLLQKLLMLVGLKSPVLLWALAPFAVFLVISVAFKIAALAVHEKVDVFYRYHAGDLRLALWERLSRRLGLCLGLLNGASYLILLSFVINAFSSWTVPLASSDNDPKWMRLLNRLGQDLQSTAFARVARAVDPLPDTYYGMAELAGVIYHNPLIEARLLRYPAFLGIAERPELQDLANDSDFTSVWQRQDPIMTLLHHPKVEAVAKNVDLLKLIWDTAALNLVDARTFLETGKSAKYDREPMVGRWNFNVGATLLLVRRAKPNITSSDMQRIRRAMEGSYGKTSLVAMTDHQAILKNLPSLKAPGAGPQTLQGTWKSMDSQYSFSLGSGGSEELAATLENDRLTLKNPGLELVFERED